jgi:hypothetical protein
MSSALSERAGDAGERGDTLPSTVRRQARRRRRRGITKVHKIKNTRLIHERPCEVSNRRVSGQWDGDLIIGRVQRSAIATLAERVSHYVVVMHVTPGHKGPVVDGDLPDPIPGSLVTVSDLILTGRLPRAGCRRVYKAPRFRRE